MTVSDAHERAPTCPACTNGGVLDGQGRDRDTFERYSSEQGWEKVEDMWYTFRCPECGCVFQLRERQVVESADA